MLGDLERVNRGGDEDGGKVLVSVKWGGYVGR